VRAKSVPRTAGVCLVRDAIDIIPYICGHYLRLGFERLLFIDDGSSDGTFEFLDQLARTTHRVQVQRLLLPDFEQLSLVDMAVNECIRDGFRLIFPFDADEFWHLSRRQLRQMAAQDEPRFFIGHWINFVQRRDRHYPLPRGLLGVTYRAPVVAGAGMDDVLHLREAFVCTSMPKVAFWTDRPVQVTLGQHALIDSNLPHDPAPLQLFHFPVRWKSELTKRGLNYEPRRAATRRDAGENWQSRFHADIVRDGRVHAVWDANSSDARGRLDIYGAPRQLARDRRLQFLLLRGAWHLRSYRTRRAPLWPSTSQERFGEDSAEGCAAAER
jgi:hypothetical protein